MATRGLAISNLHRKIANAVEANVEELPWLLILTIEQARVTESVVIFASDGPSAYQKSFEATQKALRTGTKRIIEPRFIGLLIEGEQLVTSGRNSRLYGFLSLSRHLLSSKPRDKIYAYVGMLENDNVNRSLLAPNETELSDLDEDIIDFFRYRDIFFCARTLEPGRDPREAREAVAAENHTQAMFRELKYLTGESLFEAFWWTLMCDMDQKGEKPDGSLALAFQEYHDWILSMPH